MNTISRGLLWAGAFIIGAVGCAGDEGRQSDVDVEASDVAAQEAGDLQQVPPPAGVKFTTVEAAGAGCPQNTPGDFDSYFPDITPEGDAFTIEFYKFKNQITPSDPRPESSLSCTMRVGLTVPRGYSYTVTDIVYQGESSLPAGTSANLVTSYGYQGSGLQPSNVTHAIKTPSTLEQFKFRDVLSSSATGLQWSRCGETQLLNINMVLHIRNPNKVTGWAELNFVDSDVRTTVEDPTPSTIPGVTVNLAWRRCPLG